MFRCVLGVALAWGLCLQAQVVTAQESPAGSDADAIQQTAPLDADGHFRQGFDLFKRYQADGGISVLESAKAALTKAVELDPNHPDAPALLKVVNAELKAAIKARNPDFMAMAFSVLGGLGIFLIGMRNMSEGMQAVAGNRMRRMINAVTDNRLLATGVGTGVTCLVQSSSITTVIVVGLVNSGLMALHQAIGVIMGANIGTTITGWILVLKVGKYGLPILGVAVFVYLFSKKDRWRFIALVAMGLGMVFFGLELMKDGFKPMKGVPVFEEAFAWFRADSYFGVLKCAAVGCILTFIVQSSSATLGITIGLAVTGAIPFETAAALVLGENIGTTITAMLASIGATTNAKRAAYAHVMFNVIGVIWITAIFSLYVRWVAAWVEYTEGHNPIGLTLGDVDDPAQYGIIITFAIASTHTGFNLANTAFFLPFVRVYSRFLEWLVPDRGLKEAPHLTSLDIRMVETPIIAIENSRGEIIKMGEGVRKMLDWTKEQVLRDRPDDTMVRKVFHRETIMDNVQQEVIQYLTTLLTAEAPHATTVEGRQQLRIADEWESISDYVGKVLKARLRIHNGDQALSQHELDTMMELHDMVADFVGMVAEAFEQRTDVLARAEARAREITHRVKELRDEHMLRLTRHRVDPQLSMSYTTMLNSYRKIRDHTINIAEALSDHDGAATA